MRAENKILALDPGTTHTGIVLYESKTKTILQREIVANEELSGVAFDWALNFPEDDCWDRIAIEMIASYGMAVGKTTFETCVWIGRFIESLSFSNCPVRKVYRQDVKMNLCYSMKAKDANIRQALLDRFDVTEESLNGVKCSKCKGKGWFGPGRPVCSNCEGKQWDVPPSNLAGVKSHMWAALGVAVTAADKWEELEGF